jgi:pectate lyase
VGLGDDAKLINGNFMIEDGQVIIRNLTIENPCDVGPSFDPGDGPTGNWNSEFDGVSINAARHVWIDRVTFTDGSQTNDLAPVMFGHVRECHDGAVDIKKQANYITISNTIFMLHDKNNLVGHSDSAADGGTLKVTFHDNLFRDIGQRGPRVRYGQVHVYNNAYIGSKNHKGYPYSYSIGVGVSSHIISENNNFAIDGVDSTCTGVLKNWGGKTFVDHASLLNGKPLGADQCGYDSNVGWTPPYAYTLRPTEQVEAYVLAHAGAGKWTIKDEAPPTSKGAL